MMKVSTIHAYLSGKISGLKDLNRPKFLAAENLVRKELHKTNAVATFVYNPHDLIHTHDKTWGSYMRECIRVMCDCDRVYVLDDWKQSKGALTEVLVAKILGIQLYEINTMQLLKVSYFKIMLKLFLKLI